MAGMSVGDRVGLLGDIFSGKGLTESNTQEGPFDYLNELDTEWKPLEFSKDSITSIQDAITSTADGIIGDLETTYQGLEGSLADLPQWGDFLGQTDLAGSLGITDAIGNLKAPERGDFSFGWADQVQGLSDQLKSIAGDLRGEDPYEAKELKSVVEAFQNAYRDAYKASQTDSGTDKNKLTENFKDNVEDLLGTLPDLLNEAGNGADSGGRTAANTGKMAKDLEKGSEELKYLRDIAEREVINRFTTAEIKIEQTNNNSISDQLDIDGVADKLNEKLSEAIAIAVEGAY